MLPPTSRKVHHRREVEVFARLLEVTDLGRDDALDAD
jgi:hypothetical protein